MIANQDITVVLQGDLRADTLAAIASVRRVLPGARLVLSTFAGEPVETVQGQADLLVLSQDPGALPPYTVSPFAGPNNFNRQLVSTQAGLAEVKTPYTLKLRTDCMLQSDAFVRLLETDRQGDPGSRRMLASSFYTRHPHGLSGYLFHVSDWFIFGATEEVTRFWSAPLMTQNDATWFEREPHRAGSSPAARRFRARLTPEQHLCTEFGRTCGYRVPRFLNDRSALLVREYERFLASEFVIAEPQRLGFLLPKYAHLPRSAYQTLDCVLHSDWQALFRDWAAEALTPNAAPELLLTNHPARRQKARHAVRCLARYFRHPLILMGLARRRLARGLSARITSSPPENPKGHLPC